MSPRAGYFALAVPFLRDGLSRLEAFEGLKRRALGGLGLPQRRHAGLVQGRGAEAPALVAQPEVLLGIRDERLMLWRDAPKRLEAVPASPAAPA